MVQRLKDGADAILKTALAQRDSPSGAQVAQAEQERLAAVALDAAKDIDEIFERTKLACTIETEEDVKREVCAPGFRPTQLLCFCMIMSSTSSI